MASNRGGNRGGGSTIRRIEIQSDKAARELRRRITGDYASRYTKQQADGAVTDLLEQLADHRAERENALSEYEYDTVRNFAATGQSDDLDCVLLLVGAAKQSGNL